MLCVWLGVVGWQPLLHPPPTFARRAARILCEDDETVSFKTVSDELEKARAAAKRGAAVSQVIQEAQARIQE